MITFSFTTPRLDSSGVNTRDALDVLVGVVADARFEANGKEVLTVPELPIVELAAHLNSWLRRKPGPFEYESAAAEEALLWLRQRDGGWFIGSDWRPTDPQQLNLEAFTNFAKAFVARVRDEVRSALGIGVNSSFGQVR